MTGWRLPFFVFIKPSVADEGAEGGCPSDVQAGEAVKKAETQKIRAKETPEGARNSGGSCEANAAGFLLNQEKIGEWIDFGDVSGERGERVVEEITVQRGNGAAVGSDLFMDERIATPAGVRLLKQAETVVGVPIAVGNPAVDEPNFAREACADESVVVGPGEERREFLAQSRGNLFVGVERENPRVRRENEGGIFGVAKAEPGDVVDLCAGGNGDGVAGVGGGVEGNDDFRAPPLDAGEAAGQGEGLVFGDDNNGDWQRAGHGGVRD